MNEFEDIFIFTGRNTPTEKYTEPISIIATDENGHHEIIKALRTRVLNEFSDSPMKTIESPIKITLPDGGFNWHLAVAALSKYLMPYSIGDMKKAHMKTITYKIPIGSFVPLYYIGRKLNLHKLSRYLEISIYSLNFQCVSYIYLKSMEHPAISFPELCCQLLFVLESSNPHDIFLTSLHFAEVVLNIQKKKFPDFVCKWLLSVFKEFDKTKNYFHIVFQIVQNLPPLNANFAFTIWLYSQYFPSINGNSIFLPVLDDFDFDINLPLSEKQVLWVFKNKSKTEISPKIMPLVVPYIRSLTKTNPEEGSKLFRSVIAMKSFDPEILLTDQIVDLLPLAAHPPSSGDIPFYDEIYDHLSTELKNRGINTKILLENQQKILTLSWKQLFSTFYSEDLLFLEICYKWLKKFKDFNEENLNQFISLFPENKVSAFEWKTRFSYMIFRIYDFLNQKNQKELIPIFREKLFNCDIEKLLDFILDKNKIFLISNDTLDSIHERTRIFKRQQIQLVTLIKKFHLTNFNQIVLLPVLEDTFFDIASMLLMLASNGERNDNVLDEFISMARNIYGKIPISSIFTLSNLFPFNTFFGTGIPVNLLNEDRVLFYGSLNMSENDTFQDILINVPQLSFRIVSLFCADRSCVRDVTFQFDPPKDSIIYLMNTEKNATMIKIDINSWKKFSIPRFAFHSIEFATVFVMSIQNPVFFEVIQRSFSFIGIKRVNVIFLGSECAPIPENSPIILLKPTSNGIDCSLDPLISALISQNQPFAMNANAFKSYLAENPDFMPNLLTFDIEAMQQIRWENEPNPGILPNKYNLPIIPLQFEDDVFYHSICCQLQKSVPKKVVMENGRLFAAKISESFSIFNYDIVVDGDESSALYWGCLKHMALTTLSLFYDHRQNYLAFE